MMHCLNAAKVWWGQPIMLHILPQRVGRWEYITKRSNHPSDTQMHMQGRGVGIQPLPCMPSPDEGPSEAQASRPWAELPMGVWDLNDDQLQEVLEPLQTKWPDRRGLHSQWDHLGEIQGSLGWQSGCHWWWGSGSQKERGWRYGEAMSLPVSPPELTMDVCWLFSMFMARLRLGTPHINTFSDDATPTKPRHLLSSGVMRSGVSRPLPRYGGLEEHYPVTKGGQSRYD